MFKKSRSRALVEEEEEEDPSWRYQTCSNDKDIEGRGEEEEDQEEAVSPGSKMSKVKKLKEKREKKMFSFKDDEHLLLRGVRLTDRRGSHKNTKEEEKEAEKEKGRPEKSYCFWESVTMTMRQVAPARKPEKLEGCAPPPPAEGDRSPAGAGPAPDAAGRAGDSSVSLPRSLELPLGLPSWRGLGLEEDSSRYANLSDAPDASAVRWTALAKVKLAGISRKGRGIVWENSWKGFK